METATREQRGHPRILVMEDEVNVANALEMVLNEEGYEVNVAMTGNSALEHVRRSSYDLLVADLRLPDIDGMEVIREVKRDRPDTEVVVITGFSTVSSAVEAMKLGAFDYLPKPFTEDEIKGIVGAALKEKGGIPTEQVEREESVPQAGALIQKREVIKVLNRTTEDHQFWRDIMELGSEALEEYALRPEAKAAIVSGDLKWLNEHVGELTQKQLQIIFRRGEREVW